MVLIKKSSYLPHFLKYRKSNSNRSFLASYKEGTVIQDTIKTDVAFSLQGPNPASHPRVPCQGPTPRSQALGGTLGSWSHFSGMSFTLLRLKIQKQPLEVFCKTRVSQKCLEIHRKTHVLELEPLETLAQVFSFEF